MKSICGLYAELIEFELTKENPDREKISGYIDYIKENCHPSVNPGGSVPEQLRPHLIQPDECAGVTGTTYYKGKLIPAVARCIAELKSK